MEQRVKNRAESAVNFCKQFKNFTPGSESDEKTNLHLKLHETL